MGGGGVDRGTGQAIRETEGREGGREGGNIQGLPMALD